MSEWKRINDRVATMDPESRRAWEAYKRAHTIELVFLFLLIFCVLSFGYWLIK
jgi:hypothetical protein